MFYIAVSQPDAGCLLGTFANIVQTLNTNIVRIQSDLVTQGCHGLDSLFPISLGFDEL